MIYDGQYVIYSAVVEEKCGKATFSREISFIMMKWKRQGKGNGSSRYIHLVKNG